MTDLKHESLDTQLSEQASIPEQQNLTPPSSLPQSSRSSDSTTVSTLPATTSDPVAQLKLQMDVLIKEQHLRNASLSGHIQEFIEFADEVLQACLDPRIKSEIGSAIPDIKELAGLNLSKPRSLYSAIDYLYRSADMAAGDVKHSIVDPDALEKKYEKLKVSETQLETAESRAIQGYSNWLERIKKIQDRAKLFKDTTLLYHEAYGKLAQKSLEMIEKVQEKLKDKSLSLKDQADCWQMLLYVKKSALEQSGVNFDTGVPSLLAIEAMLRVGLIKAFNIYKLTTPQAAETKEVQLPVSLKDRKQHIDKFIGNFGFDLGTGFKQKSGDPLNVLKQAVEEALVSLQQYKSEEDTTGAILLERKEALRKKAIAYHIEKFMGEIKLTPADLSYAALTQDEEFKPTSAKKDEEEFKLHSAKLVISERSKELHSFQKTVPHALTWNELQAKEEAVKQAVTIRDAQETRIKLIQKIKPIDQVIDGLDDEKQGAKSEFLPAKIAKEISDAKTQKVLAEVKLITHRKTIMDKQKSGVDESKNSLEVRFNVITAKFDEEKHKAEVALHEAHISLLEAKLQLDSVRATGQLTVDSKSTPALQQLELALKVTEGKEKSARQKLDAISETATELKTKITLRKVKIQESQEALDKASIDLKALGKRKSESKVVSTPVLPEEKQSLQILTDLNAQQVLAQKQWYEAILNNLEDQYTNLIGGDKPDYKLRRLEQAAEHKTKQLDQNITRLSRALTAARTAQQEQQVDQKEKKYQRKSKQSLATGSDNIPQMSQLRETIAIVTGTKITVDESIVAKEILEILSEALTEQVAFVKKIKNYQWPQDSDYKQKLREIYKQSAALDKYIDDIASYSHKKLALVGQCQRKLKSLRTETKKMLKDDDRSAKKILDEQQKRNAQSILTRIHFIGQNLSAVCREKVSDLYRVRIASFLEVANGVVLGDKTALEGRQRIEPLLNLGRFLFDYSQNLTQQFDGPAPDDAKLSVVSEENTPVETVRSDIKIVVSTQSVSVSDYLAVKEKEISEYKQVARKGGVELAAFEDAVAHMEQEFTQAKLFSRQFSQDMKANVATDFVGLERAHRRVLLLKQYSEMPAPFLAEIPAASPKDEVAQKTHLFRQRMQELAEMRDYFNPKEPPQNDEHKFQGRRALSQTKSDDEEVSDNELLSGDESESEERKQRSWLFNAPYIKPNIFDEGMRSPLSPPINDDEYDSDSESKEPFNLTEDFKVTATHAHNIILITQERAEQLIAAVAQQGLQQEKDVLSKGWDAKWQTTFASFPQELDEIEITSLPHPVSPPPSADPKDSKMQPPLQKALLREINAIDDLLIKQQQAVLDRISTQVQLPFGTVRVISPRNSALIMDNAVIFYNVLFAARAVLERLRFQTTPEVAAHALAKLRLCLIDFHQKAKQSPVKYLSKQVPLFFGALTSILTESKICSDWDKAENTLATLHYLIIAQGRTAFALVTPISQPRGSDEKKHQAEKAEDTGFLVRYYGLKKTKVPAGSYNPFKLLPDSKERPWRQKLAGKVGSWIKSYLDEHPEISELSRVPMQRDIPGPANDFDSAVMLADSAGKLQLFLPDVHSAITESLKVPEKEKSAITKSNHLASMVGDHGEIMANMLERVLDRWSFLQLTVVPITHQTLVADAVFMSSDRKKSKTMLANKTQANKALEQWLARNVPHQLENRQIIFIPSVVKKLETGEVEYIPGKAPERAVKISVQIRELNDCINAFELVKERRYYDVDTQRELENSHQLVNFAATILTAAAKLAAFKAADPNILVNLQTVINFLTHKDPSEHKTKKPRDDILQALKTCNEFLMAPDSAESFGGFTRQQGLLLALVMQVATHLNCLHLDESLQPGELHLRKIILIASLEGLLAELLGVIVRGCASAVDRMGNMKIVEDAHLYAFWNRGYILDGHQPLEQEQAAGNAPKSVNAAWHDAALMMTACPTVNYEETSRGLGHAGPSDMLSVQDKAKNELLSRKFKAKKISVKKYLHKSAEKVTEEIKTRRRELHSGIELHDTGKKVTEKDFGNEVKDVQGHGLLTIDTLVPPPPPPEKSPIGSEIIQQQQLFDGEVALSLAQQFATHDVYQPSSQAATTTSSARELASEQTIAVMQEQDRQEDEHRQSSWGWPSFHVLFHFAEYAKAWFAPHSTNDLKERLIPTVQSGYGSSEETDSSKDLIEAGVDIEAGVSGTTKPGRFAFLGGFWSSARDDVPVPERKQTPAASDSDDSDDNKDRKVTGPGYIMLPDVVGPERTEIEAKQGLPRQGRERKSYGGSEEIKDDTKPVLPPSVSFPLSWPNSSRPALIPRSQSAQLPPPREIKGTRFVQPQPQLQPNLQQPPAVPFQWPPVPKTWKDKAMNASTYLRDLTAVAASVGVGYSATLSSVVRYYVPQLQSLAHPVSALGPFTYSLIFSMDRAPPPLVRLFLELAEARFILNEPGNDPDLPRRQLDAKQKKYLREFAQLMFDVINPRSDVGARFQWDRLLGIGGNIIRDEIGATLQQIIDGNEITEEMQGQLMALIDTLVATEDYLRLPEADAKPLSAVGALYRNVSGFVLGGAVMMLDPILAGNMWGVTSKWLRTKPDVPGQESLNSGIAALIWVGPAILSMASLLAKRYTTRPDDFKSYKHMARLFDHDMKRTFSPGSQQAIYADEDKKRLSRLNSRFQPPERQAGENISQRLLRIFAFPPLILEWLPHDLQVRWIVDATVAAVGGTLLALNPENIDRAQVILTELAYFAPKIIGEALGALRRCCDTQAGPPSSTEFERQRAVPPADPVEIDDLLLAEPSSQRGGNGADAMPSGSYSELLDPPGDEKEEAPEAKLIPPGQPGDVSPTGSNLSTGQMITSLSRSFVAPDADLASQSSMVSSAHSELDSFTRDLFIGEGADIFEENSETENPVDGDSKTPRPPINLESKKNEQKPKNSGRRFYANSDDDSIGFFSHSSTSGAQVSTLSSSYTVGQHLDRVTTIASGADVSSDEETDKPTKSLEMP